MSPSLKHALRAVFWGTVVGGGPFMLLTVIVAVELAEDSLASALLVAFMPVLIAAAVIIPAFVMLGLPLTRLFRNLGKETRRNYGLAAMAAGFILPPLLMTMLLFDLAALEESLFFAIPGGLAGFVTGWVWGGWREKAAAVDPEMLREAFE